MTRALGRIRPPAHSVLLLVVGVALLFAGAAEASIGDRLPEFRECVEVCGPLGVF